MIKLFASTLRQDVINWSITPETLEQIRKNKLNKKSPKALLLASSVFPLTVIIKVDSVEQV